MQNLLIVESIETNRVLRIELIRFKSRTRNKHRTSRKWDFFYIFFLGTQRVHKIAIRPFFLRIPSYLH